MTEIRPGTYIFNDANTVAAGSAVKEECAVSIVTTVVSRPAEDRAVVDGGSKSLASDPSVGPRGFGIVKGRPDIVVERLSEEHGVLRSPGLPLNLAVGDRVEIIPNHVCNAVNLADTFVALRRGRVIGEIPVSARGKRT